MDIIANYIYGTQDQRVKWAKFRPLVFQNMQKLFQNMQNYEENTSNAWYFEE